MNIGLCQIVFPYTIENRLRLANNCSWFFFPIPLLPAVRRIYTVIVGEKETSAACSPLLPVNDQKKRSRHVSHNKSGVFFGGVHFWN